MPGRETQTLTHTHTHPESCSPQGSPWAARRCSTFVAKSVLCFNTSAACSALLPGGIYSEWGSILQTGNRVTSACSPGATHLNVHCDVQWAGSCTSQELSVHPAMNAVSAWLW